MKYLHKHIFRIALLCLTATSLSSCFKEDTEGCIVPVYLKFSYTKHMGTDDKVREQVSDFQVYVFSETSSSSYQVISVPVSALDENNRYKLNLKPDNYTIIVWGNVDSNSFDITHGDVYGNMRLSYLTRMDNTATLCPSLFHGMTRIQPREEDGSFEKQIDLTKNTNLVHIILEDVTSRAGGTRTAPGTYFSVRITGSNGVYNYDNSLALAECSAITYMPTYCTSANGEVQADFTVLRLFDTAEDGLKVTITDTGRPSLAPIHDLVLSREILNTDGDINNTDDLDRKDEYTLKYKVKQNADGTWAVVGIFINGWEMGEQHGGI